MNRKEFFKRARAIAAGILFRVLFPGLSLFCASCSTYSTDGRKVYADYHGVRYTREHDGKLGRWEMYASTEKSAVGRKSLCYNADLIDDGGRHQIAAVHYPRVGMQSNLDEDYLEYQILSAKAAKIDGFFVEWGFLPHENDILLRAMQRVASKYGFEIGVNWCDGWLFYNWITRVRPEIDSREAKVGYMGRCYRYLVDSVYSSVTAATVKGRPVFYHFGPGATVDEWRSVLSDAGDGGLSRYGSLVGLRRWADWGTLENGVYVPVTRSEDIDAWKSVGEIPTPWIPARVRTLDPEHPLWDNYATEEDVIEFLKPFRDSVWMSPESTFVIKSGFAMPGMDNRGCAGWGRSHFFCIPRNGGETYESMWRFCLESRDSLDMMFIASWSDYTEGHEIEPTVENGYRELLTTLRNAARFKGEKYDESGLVLPERLFFCRKTAEFLAKCGRTEGAEKINGILDRVALQVSRGKYRRASRNLDRAEKMADGLRASVKTDTVVLSGLDRSIWLDNELAGTLRHSHYSGTISFDYLDSGSDFLFVRSETSREPASAFSVVGKLRTDNSGEWKHAKIALCPENISYISGTPAFEISGDVECRNVLLEYHIHREIPESLRNFRRNEKILMILQGFSCACTEFADCGLTNDGVPDGYRRTWVGAD